VVSTPVVDRVTYFYPSPKFNPRFAALELASMILKPDGIFVVATENHEVMKNFCELSNGFVTQSGYKIRGNNDQFLLWYFTGF
jgi:hypothetical protein